MVLSCKATTDRVSSTYNLAFFLGPGLPRGLGRPFASSATPELLLTPFFLTPSVGGGIDDGTGVPLATGVFDVDSVGLSPLELTAMGCEFEIVDDESLDGDSSLTRVASANSCNFLGDSFRVAIKLAFEDFRRAPGAVVGLAVVEAIMKLGMICDGGWKEEVGDRWFNCRVTIVIAEPFENLLKCEMHGGFS